MKIKLANRVARLALLMAVIASVTVLVSACQHSGVSATRNESPDANCTSPVAPIDSCSLYASVRGEENGIAIDWLSKTPVTLRAGVNNERVVLVVTTPCNTLNVTITVSGDSTIADEIATGAAGCDAESSARESWVREFLAEELRWVDSAKGTTAYSNGSSIEFEIVGPAT